MRRRKFASRLARSEAQPSEDRMELPSGDRTGWRLVDAALLVVLSAAPASAADEGLLLPAINFALLFATLFLLARKPIRAFFADRRAAIRKELDEAAALRKQAEERYAKWQRRLADLQSELERIRATARERAEAERDSLLTDARAAAERIRQGAANAVDQELRRARARLRDEASELAVELAAGILREKVTPQDRDRLIEEFIERIERSPVSAQRAQVREAGSAGLRSGQATASPDQRSRSEPEASEAQREGERRPEGGDLTRA